MPQRTLAWNRFEILKFAGPAPPPPRHLFCTTVELKCIPEVMEQTPYCGCIPIYLKCLCPPVCWNIQGQLSWRLRIWPKFKFQIFFYGIPVCSYLLLIRDWTWYYITIVNSWVFSLQLLRTHWPTYAYLSTITIVTYLVLYYLALTIAQVAHTIIYLHIYFAYLLRNNYCILLSRLHSGPIQDSFPSQPVVRNQVASLRTKILAWLGCQNSSFGQPSQRSYFGIQIRLFWTSRHCTSHKQHWVKFHIWGLLCYVMSK